MEMMKLMIILLMPVCLGSTIVMAITLLKMCRMIENAAFHNNRRAEQADRIKAEKSAAEEEEERQKKRAYEESEAAFQELMNYNAEQAYGMAGTAEEE